MNRCLLIDSRGEEVRWVDALDGPLAFEGAVVAEGVDEAVGHVVASVGEVESGVDWGDVCAVGGVEVG